MPRYHVQTVSRSAQVQILQMLERPRGGGPPDPRRSAGTAAPDVGSWSLSGSHRATPRARRHSCTASEQPTKVIRH